MFEKIAFDIDGTIADTQNYIIEVFLDVYRQETGRPYTGRINRGEPEIFGMFPDAQRDIIDKAHDLMWGETYMRKVSPRPYVRELFQWLKKLNIKIHIITARYPENGNTKEEIEAWTKAWFDNHGLPVDCYHIGFKEKASVCKAYGIELMVEDNYDNALDCAKVCPVMLMETKYNKNLTGGNIWTIPIENGFEPVRFHQTIKYIEDHLNKDIMQKNSMETSEQVSPTKIANDMIVLQPKHSSNSVILAVPLGNSENTSSLVQLKTECKIKRIIDLSHLNDIQSLQRDSFISGLIRTEKMKREDILALTSDTAAGYLLKTELIKKIIRRAAKLGSSIVYGGELTFLSRNDAKEFKKYRMVLLNPSETDEKTIENAKFKSDYDTFRVLEDLMMDRDGSIYKYRIQKDTALKELKKYNNRSYLTSDGYQDVDFINGEGPYHPERFEQYVTKDTYVIGDLHLDRSDKKKFNMIVDNINQVVKKDDTLLILGDFDGKHGSGGIDMVKKCVQHIRTKKVLFILGNNDPWEIKDIVKAGRFLAVDVKYVLRDGDHEIVISHCPVPVKHNQYNIHGHIHGTHIYNNMEWENHYDVWDEKFRPIKIGDAIELIKNGSYKGKTEIHDCK